MLSCETHVAIALLLASLRWPSSINATWFMQGLFWTSSLLVLFTASCVTASWDTECDHNMSPRLLPACRLSGQFDSGEKTVQQKWRKLLKSLKGAWGWGECTDPGSEVDVSAYPATVNYDATKKTGDYFYLLIYIFFFFLCLCKKTFIL